MSEATMTAAADALPSQSLVARLIGVITAPKATFTRLVPAPKVAGALVTLSLVGALLGPGIFMLTDRGQQAWMDATVQQAERSSGQPLNADAQARLEKIAPYVGYFGIGGTLVTFPIIFLIEAGLFYVIFTFGTGGVATFKQVMAVVTHSGVIGVLGLAFTTMMAFVQGTLSTSGVSPANLGALLPMLPENSFLAKFFGTIDFFRVWGVITLSIGLGVLYKKKTGTIATALFVLYAVIALVVAYFTSSR